MIQLNTNVAKDLHCIVLFLWLLNEFRDKRAYQNVALLILPRYAMLRAI